MEQADVAKPIIMHAGLEYVDPLVADSALPLLQMLHNGTADLNLMAGPTTYRGYKLVASTGAVDKQCHYFQMSLQEPIVFTEFLLDTFPWIYYVYLALGIAAISTILTISQRESVQSMLVEWPLRLLAVVLRQPALDHFSRNARLSGLVAAAASLLPFTIFAMYFELNIKLLLAVPFQHQPPARSIDELIHAMKYGGYKFAMFEDGYSPIEFATPKQKAELRALTDRFVVYPYSYYDSDLDLSVSDPVLKRVSMMSNSWSESHCADVLVTTNGPLLLLVKIKDITPALTAYAMRRELYKERERLNRALALVQPAAINIPLKYPSYGVEYQLKLNPKYNNTVRFAQYRLVLIFFGATYLGCVLVFFLETIVHKMARWLRMWHTLGTARLFH